MKRLLLLLATAIALIPVSCGRQTPDAGQCPVYRSWMPPKKFWGVELPGTVTFKMNYDDVNKQCAKPTGYYAGNRPFDVGGECFRYIDPPYKVPAIYLANVGSRGITQLCQNLLYDHGVGHERGWPDDHRGGITVSTFLKSFPSG